MDWLFDQGIVFDILPNDDTVGKIATSNRIQALACLTYLEHEPDQEHPAIWQIIFTLLAGVFGFVTAEILGEDDIAVEIFGVPISAGGLIAFGSLGLGLALIVLLVTFHINRHTKHIAAWANSWSTAIREYGQSCNSDHETGDPQENPQKTS